MLLWGLLLLQLLFLLLLRRRIHKTIAKGIRCHKRVALNAGLHADREGYDYVVIDNQEHRRAIIALRKCPRSPSWRSDCCQFTFWQLLYATLQRVRGVTSSDPAPTCEQSVEFEPLVVSDL